jgi:hypothetical protein
MKKLLLIILYLPIIVFGQEWNFGGSDSDYGRSVQQTADGGYIITGKARSFGNGLYDVILTKTDANGVEKWTRYLGQTLDEFGASVQQTADGGYIIAGEKEVPLNSSDLANGRDVLLIKTDTFGTQQWQKQYSFADLSDDFAYDVYLIKTDGSGNEQWNKTFEGTKGMKVVIPFNKLLMEDISLQGYIHTLWKWYRDVYLIKTDGSGNEQWNKTFGGTNVDGGSSVQQTSRWRIYHHRIHTSSFGNGSSDVYLIKTDVNGDSQWTKTFGGTNIENGIFSSTNLMEDISSQEIQASFGNGGNYDVYLIKTDVSGNEQWNKTFGGQNDVGFSFNKPLMEDIYNWIQESFGNGNYDVYLIKTDVSGNEQWNKTFGDTNGDYGNSVQQTTDGGYIITGYTESFGNGNYDVYLIKTDGQGNITSTFNILISSKRKLENDY